MSEPPKLTRGEFVISAAAAERARYAVRPQEVAKQYGLSLQSVYNLAAKHKWRRLKVGREVRYDVLAVAETLQEQDSDTPTTFAGGGFVHQ